MADACEMMLLAVLSPELRCQWGLSHTDIVFIGMGTMSPFWRILADIYGRRNVSAFVRVHSNRALGKQG
ncbi:hypothetical protein DPMN_043029 [Dreissena polymorpha]|uniref:Uncharacterized protein n=1 Tax=Dreissena polymorpha TaxID=45954 RepID=A0A9D4D203_DREPO|nr:hypothetical protein DPMN_043029 [Dreissena polymorpha]